jgi:hypothetical protein
MSVINLTEIAADKVRQLVERDGRDGYALRLKVVGGGCSGLQYQLMFDDQGHHRRLRRRPQRQRLQDRESERLGDLRLRPELRRVAARACAALAALGSLGGCGYPTSLARLASAAHARPGAVV